MAKVQEYTDSGDNGIQIHGEPDTNTTDVQILVRETIPAFDNMPCANIIMKENLGYKPVRSWTSAQLSLGEEY